MIEMNETTIRISDIQKDDNGYYATIDGRETRLTGGEVDYLDQTCCICGNTEQYDVGGFAIVKLYADDRDVFVCNGCLKR